MAEEKKTATIMLLSGDMDRALIAFMIATGYAAMGMEVKMWFTLWGANCLKKRQSFWHKLFRRKKYDKAKESRYRVLETDSAMQDLVELVNTGDSSCMSLSRLNLMGMGPPIFKYLLKRKHLPDVEELIQAAVDLEISFTICQICVDALGLSLDELVAPADVRGVSGYMQDSTHAHINLII